MKNSILTIVLLFFSAVLNAAESSYFTLDTRSESFAICDLESKVCNGAYGSHGGKTAYLFQRWAGGGDLEFKAIPKSEKEIVKYEFFINGQSQGAPSSNNKFRLPLSFRYQGDKLTVVGYDKFGTPTKEFRANFEVVPRPPILEGDEVSNASRLATPRIEDNKLIYDFGEYTLRNVSIFSFSGKNPKKGFFPTVSGDKKVEAKVGGEFKIEASYDSDGNTRAGFAVGGYRSEEKLRQSRNAENKQFVKGWGSMLGADVSVGATLKGEWGWQPDIREYELNSFSGLLYYDFSVKSPTLRPPWFSALYFNATLGAEGGIGAKKSYMPLMCSANIWDNIRWSGTMTPYVTLTGGVGNDKIHLEASGTGRLPIELDGRDFSAAVEGDFKFNIRCTVFWGLIDYDKDFVLLSGRRQIYPESRHSLSAFSQGEIVFRPFLDFHDSHIYHNPMLSKGNGGVAILATDVPLQPISDVVCQGNGLYWLQLNDDTTRGGINVSKLMLYSQSSNGNVQAESVWDDGRNDFGPQLQITSTGNFVAMWTKANRAWSDDESFTNALKSLNVVAAIRHGENGIWVTNVVSSCGAYNHNISMATAGENIFACWVRNRDGLLFADSRSQDQIVAAMYVNGNWNTEEVIWPNAERVGTITTDYVNGIPTCIWDEDESYDEEAIEEGVKKRLVMAQWIGGTWTISLLKADNHSNENPILTHDSTGSSVLIWSCDGAIVYSYDMGVTCAQMWPGNGSAPSRMIAIRDTFNNLKGIATLASSPGMEQKSQEILYSEYVGGSQTNSWRPIVPLTDNDVIEQYFRGVHDEANGKIKIVYQEDPFQNAVATNRYGTLKRIDYTVGIDMALCDNIQFDDDPVVGSNSIARVIIENRGLLVPSPTTNYFVRLYRGDMRLGEVSITNFPAQGERLEVDIPWNISLSQTPTNFIVRLDEDCVLSDINRANNTISSAILDAELYIYSVDVRYAGGNERIISATIGNSGFAYSREGTNVEFRIGSESGRIIGSDVVPSLSAGETMRYVASIKVDISTLNLTSEYTKVYAVIGDQARAGQIVKLDDADGDGLSNVEEGGIGSNPYSVDTDGDGIPDFDEVRTYGSSPTNFSYRITFDAGSNGLMRDGTASALVVADTGVSPRPAIVTPKSGYRFVGWEETLTPATGEMTYHAKYEEIAYYVNAVTGCDTNSGETASSSWKTLQYAVNNTPDDRRVYVADGVYEPFTCANRSIVIESVNGPRYTIIDGGGANRCATLGTSAGHTNTVLRGFTLRNGNANGNAVVVSRKYGGGAYCGTIEGCRIYGNTASCGGGISYSKVLDSFILGNNATSQGGAIYLARQSYVQRIERCSICQNSSSGSPVQIVGNGEPVVINGCLIAENFYRSWLAVNDETRDHRLTITNTTIVGNSSMPSNTSGVGYATVIDSIVWDNFSRPYILANHASSRFKNSCTYPLPSGVGNIEDDPQFVDEAHHVYLLKPGSPCACAATDGGVIGATGVAAEGGFVVGTETDGYGLILESGTVVEQGGTASFTAVEIGREFLHFKTNGVFATAEHVIDLTNIKSDILVTAVFGKRELFVDGTNGNDGNNGLSWMMAKKSISSAINDTLDYDTIFVTNGVYGPITASWKKILIQSANGASDTIIDGGGSSQCINCLENGSAITNAVIVGFTLRNGFSVNYGGGAVGGVLRDCIIVDCEATTYGGGACYSHLENCIVARNKAGTSGGGTYYGYADHCTICGNEAGASSGGSYYGTFYNSIVSKNFVGGNEVNWMYGSFDSCCTYPNRGNNPIAGDPMLVDGWNGDARLRVGSPCIEDGVQVCGAYVGEPLEGVSVSVGICGAGTVSNETVLVTSGGDATIEAVETVRPFLYWVINGEQITNHIYTITNLISDIRIAAVFGTFDWFVDAEYGDDANDGSDWNVAKQTLQAAVAAAIDNENIYVESGTYGPISSDNKRIRIESMNGAELTFIDGGGTNRCAMLGQSGISYATNTVISGFSIVNGFNASDGGAVCGGTLEDCILSDNTTYRNGGATYYSNLERCVLTRNTARFTGGGAYNGALRNCLVFGNTSGNAGGGVSSVRAYNSTIARNKTEKLLSSSNCGSGGSYQGACYNTIVWDNRDAYGNVSNYNGTAFYYSCTLPQKGTACVTNDPQFIDADAGDFHLMVGSPCIDAGLNNYVHEDFDLEWDDRIQGVKVDVGCFEGAEYATPPGQVSGLCAVRGVLTWDEMPEAEGFMIYRSTRKAPASAKYIGFSDANTYIDETAVDGTTYYYWVMAFNTLGMGMRSEAAENTWPVLLSITTSELPDATEMEGYTAQLEAIGGTPPYSWSCPARGYIVSTNSASTFAEVGVAQGWNADDNCWSLALPFDFPFYGNKYRTAYINSNGTITFDRYFDNWSYSIQNFTNRVMIAALWSDLDTSYGGDVYVSTNSDVVTICWVCQYHSGGGSVAASAKLYSNGDICLAYGNGNANGGFVGVSAGDGLRYIPLGRLRYIPLGSEMSLNAAQDILLRSGGIADGLFISEEGQITGIPTTAGVNTFTVTVTDAVGDVEEKELSIVVNENPNHKPEIDNVSPVTNVYVKVGDSANFAVAAHDPEGAILEYSWYLDGEEIEYAANSYTFTATLEDVGAHTLECVVSDGLWTDMVRHRWSFRVIRDWYVDASAEDDSGDGASSGSALYSISEALWYAEDGDTIYVAPGLYDDYLEFDSGRTVSIIATGGTLRTFFTGEVNGYDTEWYPGEAVVQSTMRGFTFRGCYLGGVTLDDCVLTCDEMGCYPSEVYGCRLFDCSVTGNVCDYSPIQRCELTQCTVAGNTVGEYGAIGYSSYVYDCIVWDNVTVNGETSNYDTEIWYDEWWDDDAEEYVSEEYAEVHIFNSCTWPMPSEIAGTGNITSDPRLVDAVNGDLRLRVGSPCFVGGAQTMGVCLGDPVAGFVLSVRIEGSGAVSPMTAVVSNGGNATFEVPDNTRPFLGFSTNGVFATAADTLTWQGVKSDGIITAVFSNFTFYVDAAVGDDANDGLSWATSRTSIQSAINDAVRGETIYVKAGTYDPIVVGAAMRLRIESVDGKEATVIDGGGERQCANLGGNDSFSSTLVGFTLTNGYSNYGGGAHGGTLIDCDVMGNYARYQGGGLYYSTAIRCQIAENKAGDTNLWSNANGGGAYSGILRNCLVVGNTAESSNYCEGGASCYSALYNCTVVDNVACGNGYGGGVAYGNLYNSVVFGNHADYDDETQYVWTTQKSLIGVDPGFIDAENGDYRLAVGSPCIDAGSNGYVLDDADLDGNERIQHYTVDIGCYEYELATPERDADADFAAQMAGTCYGVFVGVGRYMYTSSLTGPTIDATNMQARCIAKGYWRDENTVAFLDAAATKAVVRAKLATLAAKAVSGDTVLYYQSSHGGSHTSGGNYTKDAYICLHDERYEDYEMAEDLMQFAAGVKVVIILDTCHSAGMFKAMGMSSTSSAKSFALRVRDLMAERSILRKSAKSGITAADIGWIAAADYNQYSWDSLKGGAFTVAMLDGWKSGDADYDGDNRLNFHELWRYAKGIATGYYGEDATDAQCLNENVLLSRFAGTPDSTSNGESTETTPAPVEHVWLDSYPAILAAFGGDYEAMANAPSPGASGSGKIWPNGSPCYMWQDFVAGTSPTNDAVFTATIRMDGDTPVITWEPDTPELRATRVYRIYGKKTLMDANWTDITDKDMSEYHFFKVAVDLP